MNASNADAKPMGMCFWPVMAITGWLIPAHSDCGLAIGQDFQMTTERCARLHKRSVHFPKKVVTRGFGLGGRI